VFCFDFEVAEGGLAVKTSGMVDDTNSGSSGGTPQATLNPVDVFFALGSEVRWKIFQLLSDGVPRPATAVAAELGREFDMISKHLRLMRAAGVVTVVSGTDRRHVLYAIPAEWHQAGLRDFSFCRGLRW
jgi:predicted transcriptional regulator